MKTHSSTTTLMAILAALALHPAAWSQDPGTLTSRQAADDYRALQARVARAELESSLNAGMRNRSVKDPNTPYGSKDLAPPVVIEFSPGRLNSVEMMEEDLAVMTRIVEKALNGELGDEQAPVKAGIPMTLTGSGRSARAMYVEGVGPLFMIKVNFPLLAPPAVEAKQPETKASSEWEKARKELKGGNEEDEWPGAGVAGNTFNEETVVALKKALLDALKQAANIRQLKPDDFIAMSVFGGDGFGGTRAGNAPASARTPTRFSGNAFDAGGNPGVDSPPGARPISKEQNTPVAPASALQPAPTRVPKAADATSQISGEATDPSGEAVRSVQNSRRVSSKFKASPESARDFGHGTVLTIRAKKADVDALAKGDLTPENFAKQATFHTYTYAGSGYGLTSLNSWIQKAYPVRN